MCIKLNSFFIILRALAITTASLSIYVGVVTAEPFSIHREELPFSASDSFDVFTNQEAVKGLRINDDFFVQQDLSALPEIIFKLDVAETLRGNLAPIHRDGAHDKQIISLYSQQALYLPSNKLLRWSGSPSGASIVPKQLLSSGLPVITTKIKLPEFSEGSFIAAVDGFFHQILSNTTSSSFMLVGVGLISFGCLRIKIRRVEAVKNNNTYQ